MLCSSLPWLYWRFHTLSRSITALFLRICMMRERSEDTTSSRILSKCSCVRLRAHESLQTTTDGLNLQGRVVRRPTRLFSSDGRAGTRQVRPHWDSLPAERFTRMPRSSRDAEDIVACRVLRRRLVVGSNPSRTLDVVEPRHSSS